MSTPMGKLIRNLGAFLRFLGADLGAAMSGGFSVPFAFLGAVNAFGQKDLFYWLAIAALVFSLYRVWAKIRDVSLERPLRFTTVHLDIDPQSNGDLGVQVGIGLRNEGDKIIEFKVTRFTLEVASNILPQGAPLTTYPKAIEPNEELFHAYGAKAYVKPFFPIVMVVDFVVEYDNSPSLRNRKMGRRVRYEFSSFDPVKQTNRIIAEVNEP